MDTKTKIKNASVQQAVWRQSGCLLADTLVVIWKLTARRSLSEPPPDAKPRGVVRKRATVQ